MSFSQAIFDFTTLAIQAGGYMDLDRIYVQNQLLDLIGETTLAEVSLTLPTQTASEIQQLLLAQAKKNNIVQNDEQQAILAAKLMDFLTPPPSVVNALFAKHYDHSPQEATAYFFTLCQNNGAIQASKQPGALNATVDNAQQPCAFCLASEGYAGIIEGRARSNQRFIRMNLDNQSWAFRYATNPVYSEQGVITAEDHQPQALTRSALQRLFRIVEVFPHYFVSLPSQSQHAHYQTGPTEVPLIKAAVKQSFPLAMFPEITAGIVDSPLSVIRLQSADKERLVLAVEWIRAAWQAENKEGELAKQPDLVLLAHLSQGQFVVELVLQHAQSAAKFNKLMQKQPVFEARNKPVALSEILGSPRLPTSFVERLAAVSAFEATPSGQQAFERFLRKL
ncbi:MAG: hypothetical protein ACK5MW_02640 [Enterococcus sp.]